MVSIESQLDNLGDVIAKTESKIKALEISKPELIELQHKLDSLESKSEKLGHDISALQYSRLLELQALIHYASGEIELSQDFTVSASNYLPDGESLVSTIVGGMATVHTSNQLQDTNNPTIPVYMTVSTTRLVILCILTGGVYVVYWAYKNFKALKTYLRANGDKSAVMPILSALFFGLTSYSLFTRVRDSHRDLGLDSDSVKAGSYAWAFLFFDKILIGFIPIIWVQRHMNTAKQTAIGDTMIRKGTSVGEVLFVILGTLYIWLSIFSAASGGTYTESYEVSSKRANVNLLTSLYETCSADLISREKTLDLYNEQSVNAYNVDVDKCEKTRLDQNSAVYEYNRLIGQ